MVSAGPDVAAHICQGREAMPVGDHGAGLAISEQTATKA